MLGSATMPNSKKHVTVGVDTLVMAYATIIELRDGWQWKETLGKDALNGLRAALRAAGIDIEAERGS